MSSLSLVSSDEGLFRHGQRWPGVPLFLRDGLLMPEPSEWALDMKMRGLADATIESYAKSVAIWMEAMDANKLDWRDADAEVAEMFSAALRREGVSSSTTKLRLLHVHEFYKWAKRKKHVAEAPFHLESGNNRGLGDAKGKEGELVRMPSTPKRRVKPQSSSEFEKILAKNPRKSESLSKRDELMAEAARYMGLRRSEVAALRVDQFDALDLSQEALVIEIVSAKGKGRVDSVLVPRLYAQKVLQYVESQRAELIARLKGADPAYIEPPELFLNDRGKNKGKRIDPDYMGDSWRRSAVRAGIDSRFHDNRSSFATNAARIARQAGENARATVKDLLRHRQESTAEIYVEFEEMQSDFLMRARLVNDAYNKEAGKT